MEPTETVRSTPADDLVTIRRRWNDPASARAPRNALRDLRIRSEPGGVCGPLERPFLHARVWCDHLVGDQALHRCESATAPHELEVCILERDNAPALYAGLLPRQMR